MRSKFLATLAALLSFDATAAFHVPPYVPVHRGSSMLHVKNVCASSHSVRMSTSSNIDMYGFVKDRVPGLAIAGAIGFAGEFMASKMAIALSPLLYATAIGIFIGNLMRIWDPEMKRMEPTGAGMSFAKRRLLRAGIILYGAKITFAKILGIGLPGLLTDLYVVSSTLCLGFALGKMLGLSNALTTLISTGSAICGCSAVAATQPIINAEAHEVAAAIGVVVMCGTSAMFLYPALFNTVPTLAADPRLMGIYTVCIVFVRTCSF
jgi:uncharacterized integral membrane protein (TIGR00698 family)